jgi:hypothetical protein
MKSNKLFYARPAGAAFGISFDADNEKEARQMMRIFFGVDKLRNIEVWSSSK